MDRAGIQGNEVANVQTRDNLVVNGNTLGTGQLYLISLSLLIGKLQRWVIHTASFGDSRRNAPFMVRTRFRREAIITRMLHSQTPNRAHPKGPAGHSSPGCAGQLSPESYVLLCRSRLAPSVSCVQNFWNACAIWFREEYWCQCVQSSQSSRTPVLSGVTVRQEMEYLQNWQ